MPDSKINKNANKNMNKNLRKLTQGEVLWLMRRWRGCTQAEMGLSFCLSEKRYNYAETDRASLSTIPKLPRRPAQGDRCALARRRHGLSMHATAELLGCSHVTMLAREKTNDKRLTAAWRRLSYVF